MIRPRTAARALSVAITLQAALNSRLLRRPPPPDEDLLSGEWLSVLLPLRNEADRVMPCLRALSSQQALHVAAGVEFVVLDDDSSDGTAALVEAVCGHELRMRLVRGTEKPAPGFLGKPWACAQLAEAADPRSTVYVFLDADVVLTPHALTRAVTLLRQSGLDFLSPYPRQQAESGAERLLQPMLQWSFMGLLPLRIAERAGYETMAIANGQLLVVDAHRYREAGGHAAAGVRGAVLEDVALARSLRRHRFAGGMADGTALASCRMYDGWPAVRDGYTKSLWAAAGGRKSGSFGQIALLCWLYLRPDPLAYAAGVASRVITARATGGRAWPDALAHPLSVALLSALTARSWQGRITGALQWKDRPVVPDPA